LSSQEDPNDFVLRVEWRMRSDGEKPPTSQLSYPDVKNRSLLAAVNFWEDLYRQSAAEKKTARDAAVLR
jgi:hypothetical protein